MAKTQAERAREYRNRQRGTTRAKRDGAECDARHENVTVPERDAPSVTAVGTSPGGVIGGQCWTSDAGVTGGMPSVVVQHKPAFDDLPSDVQSSIERMCSENNNGARAGSHSRAAMTERALSYQAMFGKRSSQGIA